VAAAVQVAQLAMLKLLLFQVSMVAMALIWHSVDWTLDHHSRFVLLQRWLDKEPKLRQHLDVAHQQ
jgi:hypothetical protein